MMNPKIQILDNPFSTRQRVSNYNDVLEYKENMHVPNVKSIDVDYLEKNVEYFGGALSVCEKLSITNLMQFNKDFDGEMVDVFFAMAHLESDEDGTLTCMANGKMLSAT
ncbi:hypothetical protein D1007_00875 [Hordeum vulgare]|nr:hypothetical protein D1007_00875 [Hordeum vulgare]